MLKNKKMIEVIAHEIELKFSSEKIYSFMTKILEERKRNNWELCIIFCDTPYIHLLNKTYKKVNSPTDILSFSAIEQEELKEKNEVVYAGDLFLCLSEVEKNVFQYNVALGEELARLLIHGLLHLEGYAHQSYSSEEPMLKLQEKLLKKIGPIDL